MKNYSLIIQGPILSKGVTGATYKDFFVDKSKAHVVDYNSMDSINRTLRDFGQLFDEIVISTWEGEAIAFADLAGDTSHVQLLHSKDTTETYLNPAHPNGQIGLLKQFYSMQKGLEALQNKSPDHFVVKIRTDQYVDLALLLKEHQAQSEAERQEKLFISYFTENALADFYFVSRRDKMMTFCESIMNIPQYPQINVSKTSVHLAIPYAYYIYQEKKRVKNEPGIFLKSLLPVFQRLDLPVRNCEAAKKMVDFIAQHFKAFSNELYFRTEWRGSAIAYHPVFKDHLVAFGHSPAPKLNGLNLFIYLSPETYFEQQGKRNLKALLGLLNFMLFQKLPFYKKWVFKSYQPQSSPA